MSDHEIMFIACGASAIGFIVGFFFGWQAALEGRSHE